jgi:hypothetical protein
MNYNFDMKDFTCPISHQLIRDPVTASDGFLYERESIEMYIQYQQKNYLPITSPMTREIITQYINPNNLIKNIINNMESVNPVIHNDRYKYDLKGFLIYCAKKCNVMLLYNDLQKIDGSGIDININKKCADQNNCNHYTCTYSSAYRLIRQVFNDKFNLLISNINLCKSENQNILFDCVINYSYDRLI